MPQNKEYKMEEGGYLIGGPESIPEGRLEAAAEAGEAGRKASGLIVLTDVLEGVNPKAAEKVEKVTEPAKDQAEKAFEKERATWATMSPEERQAEKERRRSMIEDLNKTVQQHKGVEKFGAEEGVGYNKGRAYGRVEEKVVENEAAIRGLEKADTQAEIDRLKNEVADLNKTVQEHGGVERFGAEVGYSSAKAYGRLEEEVAKKEARIKELEGKMRGPTKQAKPQEGGKPTEPEKSEDLLPKGGLTLFREAHEKAKEKPSAWGWIKERAKGLATFGYWEFHRGEQFRGATKEQGKEVAAMAANIEKVPRLSLEDALEDAEKIKKMMQAEGKEKAAGKDYERYSEAVTDPATKEKCAKNSKVMDAIMAGTMAKLEEKLKTYKSASGLKVMEIEKNRKAFRENMREELLALQAGQVGADNKKFAKLLRDSFDPNYWSRYVYGGLELALEAAGIKLFFTHYIAAEALKAKAAAAASEAAVKGKAVAGAAKMEAVGDKLGMKDTIWNTCKIWLKQQGVAHPTNSEIMQLSKQVAVDNHIGVAPWNIPGNPMDVAMHQGYLLKWTKAVVGVGKTILTKHAAAAATLH